MLELVFAVDYSFNVSFSDMEEESSYNEIWTDCRCFLKKGSSWGYVCCPAFQESPAWKGVSHQKQYEEQLKAVDCVDFDSDGFPGNVERVVGKNLENGFLDEGHIYLDMNWLFH